MVGFSLKIPSTAAELNVLIAHCPVTKNLMLLLKKTGIELSKFILLLLIVVSDLLFELIRATIPPVYMFVSKALLAFQQEAWLELNELEDDEENQ